MMNLDPLRTELMEYIYISFIYYIKYILKGDLLELVIDCISDIQQWLSLDSKARCLVAVQYVRLDVSVGFQVYTGILTPEKNASATG